MERDDTRVERRNTGGTNWMWVLLLPIFFVMGWIANDALSQSNNFDAEPGVGGGPPAEERQLDVPETEPPEDEVDATPEPTTIPTSEPTPEPTNEINEQLE